MKQLIFFALAFLTLQIAHSQKFSIKEIPEWVVEVSPKIESKVSKYDVNKGVYTSLYDSQVNLGKAEVFSRVVLNIVSNGGVSNASEIAVVFDTSYQYLEFHYLYIWRNGKKIDRTAEITLEYLKNENNLQSNMYSGNTTAYDILEDIRKDDRVEYAFTLKGENPIYDNNQYRLFTLEDTNPVDYFSLRILHPKSEKFYSHCNGCEKGEVKESFKGDNKIIEIVRQNMEAGDYEESTPSWVIPYAYYEISSSKNWETVNNWALSVFDLKDKDEIEKVYKELFTGKESKEEKLTLLIDYVQNEIRYMGIESGMGSIKPYSPNQVIKQRFGDCKDKSLLLATLMRGIGIKEAYPALVNTSLQHGVSKLLPSGHLFDHCILYFEYDNKGYWIDPTMTQQGGTYATRVMADFGEALIVRAGSQSLTDMKINDKYSRTEIVEMLDVSSFTEQGTYVITSKLYGANADLLRRYFEYYSVKEISDQLRNSYASTFPNIQDTKKIEIEDDVETNVFTLVESYTITDFWQEQEEMGKSLYRLSYEPIGLYNYVSSMNCEEKKFPVMIPYPSSYEQTTTMLLPARLDFVAPNNIKDNIAFSYAKESVKISNQKVITRYKFKTNTKEISPDDFQGVCTDMHDVTRDIMTVISYPRN